ncbi:MAG: metallophosphoesterase [Pseudomonadota bacterium]|nr:metallophosphoesterase [Pseudomonadota bacterium]
MFAFALACSAATLLLTVVVGLRYGPRGAVPAAVALGLQALLAIGAYRLAGPWTPAAWYFQATVYAMVISLARAQPQPRGWRLVVSWPAAWFVVGSFLALPWAVTGVTLGAWVPFALAALGVLWSLTARQETVTIDLSAPTPSELGRIPQMIRRRRGLSRPGHAGLRVVQISDPHLGAFMSEARLRRICARAVAAQPDLILLTGDYFTRETHADAAMLTRALGPLRAHPHVYACRGNHDLECPDAVAEGLAGAGVRLLIDESTTVTTRAGRVQIVGMDFHWRDRPRSMRGVLVDLVRPHDGLRIVLLHDPGAFRHLPDGAADLVLSGHTHGGHVGLVSLGLDWTAVRALAGLPDHGAWGQRDNRMYVHRANGHYGFPLRIGVPAEESVLELVRHQVLRDRV